MICFTKNARDIYQNAFCSRSLSSAYIKFHCDYDYAMLRKSPRPVKRNPLSFS
jgi:hypothetical protein